MDEPAEPLTVVIAMLTFRRPDDLADALPAIEQHARSVDEHVRILIVDNDPDASAMPLAHGRDAEFVRFVHEPTPGIAAARNRALGESQDADVLIFIDDDERPQPGWLSSMVETWRSTCCAAVAGPVISTFERPLEPWIEQGGYFDRRRSPTGTHMAMAATNNLLLDMATIRTLDLHFDMRFGTSGGSDTLFTRQLVDRGGRIVWCDEAVVVDVVPANRSTRSWVVRRALRMGNSWSLTALALHTDGGHQLGRRISLSAMGLARIFGGAGRALVGVVTRSTRHEARGVRTLARGAGMLGGAWGYVYVEYRRPSS